VSVVTRFPKTVRACIVPDDTTIGLKGIGASGAHFPGASVVAIASIRHCGRARSADAGLARLIASAFEETRDS
jgi:hypothetical protein